MKMRTFFSTAIITILLVGCSGVQPATNSIVGVDKPILVEGAQLTVLDARIRSSMQTHYMMSYPQSGHAFYVVSLQIEGIDDDPDLVLDWGTNNLLLTNENVLIHPSNAQRTISGEQAQYKVGEELTFLYLYYFEIPINANISQYSLQLPDNQSISLSSIIRIPEVTENGNVEINLYDVISGGSSNRAGAYHATIGGGQMNTASASHATVSGGRQNLANYFYATIGGGYANTAIGRDTVIGGGSRNTAGDARATVGGGIQNNAIAPDTTIGGGAYNLAADDYASVGGGSRNLAEGFSSTIAGGLGNTAAADQTTISGGLGNQALALYATVGGGHSNIASGTYSTVAGGLLNIAGGDYSFASGHRAQVDSGHTGVFLFADSNNFDFLSDTANEFAVRATGGVRFVTAIDEQGNPISGVSLSQGSGTWSSLSDRNMKENISPVDHAHILDTLAEIPISTWNYISQDSSIQHIGPMAQNMYASFGFGEDNKHISTVDADGISLAAIQGLYSIVQEQDAKINLLQTQIKLTSTAYIVSAIMLLFLFWQNFKSYKWLVKQQNGSPKQG